jgi:hypothetical protein
MDSVVSVLISKLTKLLNYTPQATTTIALILINKKSSTILAVVSNPVLKTTLKVSYIMQLIAPTMHEERP